jgi:glycosyltransferase involved in cell wall biosynthesis
MKICLFDWNAGGHHNFYARSFAEALSGHSDVVVAGSEPLIGSIDQPSVELHSLGAPRPRPDPSKGLDKASLAQREIELLRTTIAATRPDRAIVLFADPILRWLATADRFPCRVSAFVMFSTAHFPRAYGLPLTMRERASAEFKEWNIRRWRRRPDADVLFGLDAEAVERWGRQRGAPAHWLPEPMLEVVVPRRPTKEKDGCFLFGYFDERKGMDRLAAALSQDCDGLSLALFGDVAPEYRERLQGELALLERAGVQLETDFRRVPYADAMEKMSRSRCALLSFGWRPSGSRVLLEAAAARTPVVVGSDSAVGKLVERHGLGRTANPADPAALREAILSIALDPQAPDRYEEGLRRYAEELHGERFGGAVRNALGVPAG